MSALVKDSRGVADDSKVSAVATAPARLAGSALLACQSDERLVALTREGHERAFDALVERYRRPLIRFCSRLLPESRAEDAVQQAFINAHTALDRGKDPPGFKPWTYGTPPNGAPNMIGQKGGPSDATPPASPGVSGPT